MTHTVVYLSANSIVDLLGDVFSNVINIHIVYFTEKSIKESIVGQNQEDKELLHFPEEETKDTVENVSKSQLGPTIKPKSEGKYLVVCC